MGIVFLNPNLIIFIQTTNEGQLRTRLYLALGNRMKIYVYLEK